MPTPGCNCAALYECFKDRCIVIEIEGLFSGSEPGDCTTCEEFNRSYRTNHLGPAPVAEGCADCTDGMIGLVEEIDGGCYGGPAVVGSLISVGFTRSCGDDPASFTGQLHLHNGSPGFQPGYMIFDFGDFDRESVISKLDQLCNGGSIQLPLIAATPSGDPTTSYPCYADGGAKMTLTLGSGEDCVDEEPPDPPSCDGLDDEDCDAMTMFVEVKNLIDCTNGSSYYPWSNGNALYFLESTTLDSGTSTFHQDLADTGDYGNPGYLWERHDAGFGTITERYLYAIEVVVNCEDGEAIIYAIRYYAQEFSITAPDPPVFINDGNITEFTPPSGSISGTVGVCSIGFMESLFDWTDCLGNPHTFDVLTGGAGPSV